MQDANTMPFVANMPKQQITGTMEIVFTKLFIKYGKYMDDSGYDEVNDCDDFREYIHNAKLLSKFECSNFESTKSYVLIPLTLWKTYSVLFKDSNGNLLYTIDENGHRYWNEAGTTYLELIATNGNLPTMETLYNPYECGDRFPRSADFLQKLQAHLDNNFNRCGSSYEGVNKDTLCYIPDLWKPFPKRKVYPIDTTQVTVIDLNSLNEILPQKTDDISPKITNFFNTKKISRPVTIELSPCITKVIHDKNQLKR